jgi:hypothetical protein
MIRITNRGLFSVVVGHWIDSVRVGAEKAVAKIMKDAQIFATLQSPTFTGDFASNWNVSYGTPDTTFVGVPKGYAELEAGPLDSSAGLSPGRFNMVGFQLGQTAYLTNASFHDEPYAWLIENGKINFREVNKGRDHVGQRTGTHLSNTYAKITKGMLA